MTPRRRRLILDDPVFPIEDWIYEKSNGDTNLSYDDWCAQKAKIEKKKMSA